MNRHAARAAAFLTVLYTAGCGSQTYPSVKHVWFIMMENHATAEILGNTADAPYINQLANQYGVATQYFGVTHPSLPNYLAAFSGDFQGIWDDCKAGPTSVCAPEEFVPNSGDATSAVSLTPAQIASASATPHWFSGQNLVDQLEAKGLTWKAYMQSLPAVGSTDEYDPVDNVNGTLVPRKLYAQKHNPFLYFQDIRNNPTRMQQIVPFSQFASDLAAGPAPNFVWISPDQCNDMHGVSPSNAAAVGNPTCGYPSSGLDHGAIALGDQFLSQLIPQITSAPSWLEGSVIVIAWDEDDYAGYAGCCGSPSGVGGVTLGGANAPAIVITSRGAIHVTSSTQYNHYSALATIESVLGLPCLANACSIDASGLMTPLFEPTAP